MLVRAYMTVLLQLCLERLPDGVSVQGHESERRWSTLEAGCGCENARRRRLQLRWPQTSTCCFVLGLCMGIGVGRVKDRRGKQSCCARTL